MLCVFLMLSVFLCDYFCSAYLLWPGVCPDLCPFLMRFFVLEFLGQNENKSFTRYVFCKHLFVVCLWLSFHRIEISNFIKSTLLTSFVDRLLVMCVKVIPRSKVIYIFLCVCFLSEFLQFPNLSLWTIWGKFGCKL